MDRTCSFFSPLLVEGLLGLGGPRMVQAVAELLWAGPELLEWRLSLSFLGELRMLRPTLFLFRRWPSSPAVLPLRGLKGPPGVCFLLSGRRADGTARREEGDAGSVRLGSRWIGFPSSPRRRA
jgi:hypothetical protein